MNIYAVRRYGDKYPDKPLYLILVYTDKKIVSYTRKYHGINLPLKGLNTDYYFIAFNHFESKDEFYQYVADKRIVWL